MLINETAKQCNLTKKAVEYYVEQGLIHPVVLENGYRNFSKTDVELLKRVASYRKLGLSISEIKSILAAPGNLKSIISKRVLELEEEKVRQSILQKLCDGERLEDLEQEINDISSGTIIIQKLMELFPGYYGKFISLNFSGYLTEKIETKEQMQAFKEIIDFFDNVPKLEIPEELQKYLDVYLAEYSSESGIEKIQSVIREKEKSIQNIDEFVADNRKILEEYNEYRKTEEFQNSPANRLMELLKQFCETNGYYQIFIPAMKKLSPRYKEYYEQMEKADARFVEKYPELLP